MWKLYFFLILIVSVFGFIDFIPDLSNFSLGDWISNFAETVLLIGAYSYAFSKKILSTKNWKIAFWFLILWAGLGVLIDFDKSGTLKRLFSFLDLKVLNTTQVDEWVALFTLLFLAPSAYALYKLAYRRSKSK